jgi:S-adenosylmethionine/arginine decarboxylase-like enzyme
MTVGGHQRVLLMNNTHFIGEWFDCRIPAMALADPAMIQMLCAKHATRRCVPVVYEHFTTSTEAGVIGAVTANGMHLVVRTFPRHSSVIVDLFVGQDPATSAVTAMQVFDDLRDDLRPMRALLHRVQQGTAEPSHHGGRTPTSPTEVLIGPVSVRQHLRASGKSAPTMPTASVHSIPSITRPVITNSHSTHDSRPSAIARHLKSSTSGLFHEQYS